MTATTKPRALPVVPEGIPAELRARRQWVPWDYEERDGEWTKVPLDANKHFRHRASATDPASWTGFDAALAYAETRRCAGVAYLFSGDDPYTGIDLDGCRDPESGELSASAASLVAELDTYAEVSPGGCGIKLWLKAALPDGKGRKRPDLGVEVYDRQRSFAMTGHRLAGVPHGPRDRQPNLDALYARLWPAEDAAKANGNGHRTGGIPPDDAAVIARAERARNGARFAALWRGDTSGNHDDDSSADLALCNLLAFWCGPDPARIDRLFRASGLYRAKWDERRGAGTYGSQTIDKALAGRTAFYDWGRDNGDDGAAFAAEEDGEAGEATEGGGWPADIGPYTDYANARRLAAEHGEDLRFSFEWNRWLAYDGGRWSSDSMGVVMQRAKASVRALYAAAGAERDDERAKKLARWALASQAQPRLRAMVDLARDEVAIALADLDRDPWLLNVANGTLDLRAGALREHRRADLITRIAPVAYDPAATAPRWLAFLDRIMAGRAELVEFLRRAVGYTLTGDTGEECLFILYGTGRNGKTTFVETVGELLGDYAMSTPAETLMAKREAGIPNDLAMLKGSRFVSASETDEGRRLSEALVKQMTGRDKITARFMRGEWFSFTPTFKVWLSTNHKPAVRGTDNAIWSRLRLIPFDVFIPPAERDPHLRERLRAELPGILNWALAGCLAWRRDGLQEPEEVRDATQAYRAEQDVIGAWLDERCEVGPALSCAAAALYESYTTWCKAAGEEPMSQRSLGLRLRERGFEQHRTTGGIRRWRGVTVRGRDTHVS